MAQQHLIFPFSGLSRVSDLAIRLDKRTSTVFGACTPTDMPTEIPIWSHQVEANRCEATKAPKRNLKKNPYLGEVDLNTIQQMEATANYREEWKMLMWVHIAEIDSGRMWKPKPKQTTPLHHFCLSYIDWTVCARFSFLIIFLTLFSNLTYLCYYYHCLGREGIFVST